MDRCIRRLFELNHPRVLDVDVVIDVDIDIDEGQTVDRGEHSVTPIFMSFIIHPLSCISQTGLITVVLLE
jgi:hypothetical protein